MFLLIVLIAVFLRLLIPIFKGCLTLVVALAIIGWAIRHQTEIANDFWDMLNGARHTYYEFTEPSSRP